MRPQRLYTRLAIVLLLCVLVIWFSQTYAAPPAFANNINSAPAVAANWITTGNKTKASDFLGTLNNQPLVLKTNKVERIRIDTVGNVGIGTSAPGSKLTVAGLVESTSGGFKFPDGTTQTTASMAGPNGWGLGGNAGTNPATNFLGTTDNQALVFKTNNAERVRIDTSGKVGIGTNAPDEQLTVKTATANYGFVQTDGTITVGSWVGTGGGSPAGGWYGTKSNHPLHFFVNNGSPSISIATNGNVGIGTIPSEGSLSKLEVQGRITVNGILNQGP